MSKTVFFDIDSREYQGRWFTNINAWKVERPMAAAPQTDIWHLYVQDVPEPV